MTKNSSWFSTIKLSLCLLLSTFCCQVGECGGRKESSHNVWTRANCPTNSCFSLLRRVTCTVVKRLVCLIECSDTAHSHGMMFSCLNSVTCSHQKRKLFGLLSITQFLFPLSLSSTSMHMCILTTIFSKERSITCSLRKPLGWH